MECRLDNRTADVQTEDSFALTAMQQGMVYQHVVGSEDGVNVMQLTIRLREDLDVAAFKRAWQFLVKRHPALRTKFRWTGGSEARQEVVKSVMLPVREEDLGQFEPAEQDNHLDEFLKRDRNESFDIAQAPLARIALFHRGDADFECVFTYHHIILDGRSRSLLVEELFVAYEAFRTGAGPQLETPVLFRDHIRTVEEKFDESSTEEYWRKLLRDFRAPTRLVVDGIDPDLTGKPERSKEHIYLKEGVTERLQEAAKHHGVTLNTVFQGAWAVLLSRYTGEEDVLFGALRAGRAGSIERAGDIAGMFINNLPVRVNVSPDAELGAWLNSLRQQAIDVRPFEHTSLATVQKCSSLPVNVSLFDSVLVFDPRQLETVLSAYPGDWSKREFTLHGNYGYPLTLNAWEESPMMLEMVYDTSLFGPATIRRILGHMEALLESIAAKPDQKLGDLELVSEDERQELLASRSRQHAEFPAEKTLHVMFSLQAQRTPDNTAVTCGAEHLTYRELDCISDRLASELMLHDVHGCAVGLCAEPSLDMIVGILGILKAGGAYLPLDPAYPTERLSYMLNDAGAPVVVVQEHLKSTLGDTQATAITFDRDAGADDSQLPAKTSAPDTAYVMYTSGSTGRPKGVQVTHHNVVRLFDATREQFNLNQEDVFALFHSFSFDVSGWEIWGALLHGGRLVVVSTETRKFPESLYDLLKSEGVTELSQTPSAFRELVRRQARSASEPELKLRHIILVGEALDPPMLEPWFEKYGDESPQVINMYGPTEATIYATYRRMKKADVSSSKSMIGGPLSDLVIHILDDRMRPMPVGVPGELYIGGDGVAVGYLNRPELTAERFVTDPFSPSEDARLYRTGDIARYMPDGDIEYIGRTDAQLQLRGFRVEPGEIEGVLREHPAIRDAVVVAIDDGHDDQQLVAYIIPNSGHTAREPELRSMLRNRLPEHMAPSAYVFIDKFPLTVNGKLDRRALPAPQRQRPESEHRHVAPSSEMERMLAKTWREVLRLDEVGVNDNFFDLGGHSLLILRVHDRVQEELKKKFQITKVFQYPTIASFAKFLESGDSSRSYQAARDRAQRQRQALARLGARNR